MSGTTRRAMLTSSLALPALAATPALATGPVGPSAFDQRVVHYCAIEKALNAHPAGWTLPDHPDYERLDREETALCRQSMVAFEAVMDTPAPSIAAVVTKLEIAARYHDDEDGHFATVIADLRRLGALA